MGTLTCWGTYPIWMGLLIIVPIGLGVVSPRCRITRRVVGVGLGLLLLLLAVGVVVPMLVVPVGHLGLLWGLVGVLLGVLRVVLMLIMLCRGVLASRRGLKIILIVTAE